MERLAPEVVESLDLVVETLDLGVLDFKTLDLGVESLGLASCDRADP